jgi:hypothetical protein
MRRHDKQVVAGLITFLLLSFAFGRLALTGNIASVFLLLQLFGLADLNRRATVCGTADRRLPICVVHAWWLTTLASIPVPPSPTRDFIPSRQPRSVAGAM